MATFCQVTRPSTTEDGLYAARLRFGEQQIRAVLAALVGFCYVIGGFANRQLVERVDALLPTPSASHLRPTAGSSAKGSLKKIPHVHRYRLTSMGRRVAVLFTKTYGRVLAPGLSALDPCLPADVIETNELSTAWRCFDQALDAFIEQRLIAA